MANESTSSTINDFIYSAFISDFVMATLAEHALPMGWCKEFDLRGRPSNAVDVGYLDSDFGSANDDGAGVDTEYDATEGTALSNTALSTSKYNFSASEYGIASELTDNVEEDSIDGIDLLNRILGHLQRALALAWSKDFIDLFTSLSNQAATSGSDLTVAQLLAGQTGIRVRGGVADDGLVSILDNEQCANIEAALIATSTSAAVYATAADRILGVDIGPNNGMGTGRQVLTFRGYPVVASGIGSTSNSGADVNGATFTPSSPANDPFATFGNIIKRAPRFETERNAKGRSTDLVLTMRMGAGELQDATGSLFTSDAPA